MAPNGLTPCILVLTCKLHGCQWSVHHVSTTISPFAPHMLQKVLQHVVLHCGVCLHRSRTARWHGDQACARAQYCEQGHRCQRQQLSILFSLPLQAAHRSAELESRESCAAKRPCKAVKVRPCSTRRTRMPCIGLFSATGWMRCPKLGPEALREPHTVFNAVFKKWPARLLRDCIH